MRYAAYQEAWEMKPRKLSIEEIEHPGKVIDEFFEITHLPGARGYMWELMKALVTGSFSDLRSRDRTKLLHFYEQMEKLVEVAHVIHQKNNQSLSPSKVSYQPEEGR